MQVQCTTVSPASMTPVNSPSTVQVCIHMSNILDYWYCYITHFKLWTKPDLAYPYVTRFLSVHPKFLKCSCFDPWNALSWMSGFEKKTEWGFISTHYIRAPKVLFKSLASLCKVTVDSHTRRFSYQPCTAQPLFSISSLLLHSSETGLKYYH